ncbi:hypothetical protein [Phormidium tenue]|uniref:Uncharacterized protein n=1 Tax=Phormidium tenue NIES-30 TaxID=549789 RepID=A0A1U7J936_9CYAN|nr:hypothetical protein [Phormidium tenue]MBD2230972.1 hypothetical protein [Phormidium tenue FACHB-1052]OKH49992.1 hypothetical protein NIES30_04590 [Phormidium tenue NIES-30]
MVAEELEDVMNRLVDQLSEFCSQGQINEAQELIESFCTRLAEDTASWQGNDVGYVPTLFDWEPQPYRFIPGEPVDPTKFDTSNIVSILDPNFHPHHPSSQNPPR